MFKLLIVGDASVGKTGSLLRFTDGIFTDNFIATIGVDSKTKVLSVGSKKICLQIWDTAGQERFRTLTAGFYRGAHGIVVMYDITNAKSFESVAKWFEEIRTFAGAGVATRCLVANKCDLAGERKVSAEQGEQLARDMGVKYMECSAKTGSGVNEVFQYMAKDLVGHVAHKAGV